MRVYVYKCVCEGVCAHVLVCVQVCVCVKEMCVCDVGRTPETEAVKS